VDTLRQLVVILLVVLVVGLLVATLWNALILHGEPLITTGGFLVAGVMVLVTRVAQEGARGHPLSRALAILACIVVVGFAFPIARELYSSGPEPSVSREFLRFAGGAYGTLCGGLAILLFLIDAFRKRINKGW
jgi:hypothetical protein